MPVQTFNPIKINFQHIWQLIKDAWHTKSLKDKLVIWFKPTGWRPNDVASNFPIYKIDDVYNFSKYKPASSRFINFWSWIQLAFILAFTSFLFYNIAAIGMPNILLYAALIFVSVYSCTELMDGNKNAYLYEIGKNLFIIILLYHYQSWFGFYNPFVLAFIFIYVFATTIIVSYHCLYTLQKANLAN